MSGKGAIYLDSSAIVKLVIAEPESKALSAHLRRKRSPLVSSALARVEVARALFSLGEAAARAGTGVLASIELIRIGDRVLGRAAELLPVQLRSLDAIHLATAVLLEQDLDGLVTYDARMQDAAERLGLPVIAPG